MSEFFFLCSLALFLLGGRLSAQIYEPVKWTFTQSKPTAEGQVTFYFEAKIASPWHMYDLNLPADGPVPTSFSFANLENVSLVGKTTSANQPIEKEEPAFGGMLLRYYEQSVRFSQSAKIKQLDRPYRVDGGVEYMCCNDQQCLPPQKASFAFDGPAVKKSAATSERLQQKKNISSSDASASSIVGSKETVKDSGVEAKVDTVLQKQISSETDRFDELCESVVDQLSSYGETNPEAGISIFSILLSGFLGGLLAVLTPCVWPVIPMTVSFFLKRSADKRKARMQALFYGLSIIFIYLFLGILVTVIFDASALNSLATNAVFNIFLFLLLLVFAFSFLGGFNLELPASWSTVLDNKADQASGVFAILLMASTLVIVSFSCTGPIIGTLLVAISNEGSFLGPIVGMFGFALALAIPFTFFAFFPSLLKTLPRSGSWLNVVKVLLGFFELAFSLKFLSVADQAYGWNLLSRQTFIAIWISIFVAVALYLLGKIILPNDTIEPKVSVPRFIGALCSFSFALYLVPGLFGAPINVISAFAPPLKPTDASLYSRHIEARTNDYETALEIAKRENKPILIDFTGFGCVNCRKMENVVWSDPEVQHIMGDQYVLASLYVDDRRLLKNPITVKNGNQTSILKNVGDKWSYFQRQKFGSNAQPFYVLIDGDGKVLNHSFAFTETPSEFKAFLEEGLRNRNK